MNVEVPASQLLGTEGEGVAAAPKPAATAPSRRLCAEASAAMTEAERGNARIQQDAQAVREPRLALPGAAAPHGRHVHRARRGDLAHPASESQPAAGSRTGSRLASGAKSKVGYAARFIAEQAVQLHGGMGMSDELNVGHYFKRISSINIQFGDPAYHLMRYAQQRANVASEAVAGRDPDELEND
jgi:alkylation response protein AidB-like acyl-CoA dehydrogenase